MSNSAMRDLFLAEPGSPEENRAKAVLEAQELRLCGMSLAEVAELWNSRGKPPLGKGSKWNKQAVHRLLKKNRGNN